MKNIFKSKRIAKLLVIMIFLFSGITMLIKMTYSKQVVDIVVVGKCEPTTTEFWKNVYSGMDLAIQRRGGRYTLLTPKDEKEIEKQKELLIEAINLEPDVIILAASDYDEMAEYAMKVSEANIPLVVLDSDVNISFDHKEVFIGTDSKKAGKELGEFAKANGGGGKAIILSHLKGAQTADDREEGIKEGYGEEEIVGVYSCDSSIEVARSQTQKILKEKKDITKVFATNEAVTIGAAKAVEELGLQDKVKVYGFDANEQQVEYLESGGIEATIIQNPFKMGYLAIENAINVVEGGRVKPYIETEFLLINKGNMYENGKMEFLFPFN